jgi:hypothetical protein
LNLPESSFDETHRLSAWDDDVSLCDRIPKSLALTAVTLVAVAFLDVPSTLLSVHDVAGTIQLFELAKHWSTDTLRGRIPYATSTLNSKTDLFASFQLFLQAVKPLLANRLLATEDRSSQGPLSSAWETLNEIKPGGVLFALTYFSLLDEAILFFDLQSFPRYQVMVYFPLAMPWHDPIRFRSVSLLRPAKK